MDDSIQNGIGDSGLSDQLMPGINRELTDDKSGAKIAAIVEDLQEVPTFCNRERCATPIGSGPLMIMIHGFPDYWYTWRLQMEALAEDYQCVAVDTRGYNLSDKPKGAENYAMSLLVGDVARRKYVEAFERSDVEAMLNYYKKNYPKKKFF